MTHMEKAKMLIKTGLTLAFISGMILAKALDPQWISIGTISLIMLIVLFDKLKKVLFFIYMVSIAIYLPIAYAVGFETKWYFDAIIEIGILYILIRDAFYSQDPEKIGLPVFVANNDLHCEIEIRKLIIEASRSARPVIDYSQMNGLTGGYAYGDTLMH